MECLGNREAASSGSGEHFLGKAQSTPFLVSLPKSSLEESEDEKIGPSAEPEWERRGTVQQ